VIGSDGWLVAGRHRRCPYDQQPVEAAALIDACKAAYRASGEETWLIEMRRCFTWYLGQNDAGVSLIEFKPHGCYDGLVRGGVNQNFGSESCVSWLLSLLTMHEMQPAEAPDPSSAYRCYRRRCDRPIAVPRGPTTPGLRRLKGCSCAEAARWPGMADSATSREGDRADGSIRARVGQTLLHAAPPQPLHAARPGGARMRSLMLSAAGEEPARSCACSTSVQGEERVPRSVRGELHRHAS
jgi:hypothetical protein